MREWEIFESKDGYTVLHYCASNGMVEGIHWSLEQGLEVDCKDHKMKWTPLLFATYHKELKSIRALLDAGADIEARTTYHYTPLVFAMSNNDYEAMCVLLDYGANVNNVLYDPPWTPGKEPQELTEVIAHRNHTRTRALLAMGLYRHRHMNDAMGPRQDKNVVQMVGKQIWSQRLEKNA